MADTENNMAATSAPEMPLPVGFDTVENLKKLEILPNGNLKKQFVNVIGFVMDYQPPMKTRGTGKQFINKFLLSRLILFMQILNVPFRSKIIPQDSRNLA